MNHCSNLQRCFDVLLMVLHAGDVAEFGPRWPLEHCMAEWYFVTWDTTLAQYGLYHVHALGDKYTWLAISQISRQHDICMYVVLKWVAHCKNTHHEVPCHFHFSSSFTDHNVHEGRTHMGCRMLFSSTFLILPLRKKRRWFFMSRLFGRQGGAHIRFLSRLF